MFPEDKLRAIREYLGGEFNSNNITDREDFDREAQTFRIDESNRIYLVTVTREFIDDNDAESISSILKRFPLKNRFDDPNVNRIVFAGPGEEIISVEN